VHVDHAEAVGFQLGPARVALGDQLGAEHAAEHGHGGVVLAFGGHADGNAADHDRTLGQGGARLGLGTVPGCGMDDLVTEYGGQFGLGAISVNSPRLIDILPPGRAQALGTELLRISIS
jgi:hypothetical protein